MRYYLAMIWLLWFVAFRCVQNEKVKVEKYDGNVGLYEPPNTIFDLDTNGVVMYRIGTTAIGYINLKTEDSTSIIEIGDSKGVTARSENGKWQIEKCENTIEVLMRLLNEIKGEQKQETLNATYTKQ